MATESMIKLFKQRVQEFGKLDKHSIYRDDLGKFSLKGKLKDRIDNMLTMLLIEEQYLIDFSDEILQDIVNNLQDMKTTVDRQRTRPEDDYIKRNSEIFANFIHRIGQINIHKPHFKLAKIDDMLLEDLKRKDEQYDKLLSSRLGDVDKIRDSAAGVAIEQAQIEFSNAAKSNRNQSFFWGSLSAILIYIFMKFVYSLMDTNPAINDGIGIVYFTAIRLTVLFALGAIIAFCLKILRANLHLRERNAHRERLSNNLGAIVAFASESQKIWY